MSKISSKFQQAKHYSQRKPGRPSTPKQRLAQEANWSLAQIRGAVGVLKQKCFIFGLAAESAELDILQTKLEKSNNLRFHRERAKL